VFLRGGKEAFCSNNAMIASLRKGLEKVGFSGDLIQTTDDTSREASTALMTLSGYVDLLIPRGGKGLIRSVVENATVPVIETGAGNCHVYVEKSADFEMASKIVKNAKMQRPSVCNAAENLLVDREIAKDFLPLIKNVLEGTELRGCAETVDIIGCAPATEEDFFTEYDDYIMSLKVVGDYKEAVEHINIHSTGHSEAIVTKNTDAADYFTSNIDSAAVYVNASTRFTDGEEFGFGAEIGISTQRLHARGPMGLSEMTTVKYIVVGNGQTRG
jgi:glutamate-5-semialdehyde dehydrogenase